MKQLQPSEQARLVLAVSGLVTAALYLIPKGRYLAYPLMLLSTLAHEMGHGVAAILVGGRFERFEMWADGSGLATWSGSSGRLDLALVAAGGLVGPSVLAALGFVAGRTAKGSRTALWVCVVILLFTLVLVVRNLFGAVFVGAVLLLCWLAARRGSDEVAQLVLVFLAVQLALSVFSRGDYLFVPVAQTSEGAMPSDVGQMAAALFLPYWFWGAVCGAFSIAVLFLGLRFYWRPYRAPRRRRGSRSPGSRV